MGITSGHPSTTSKSHRRYDTFWMAHPQDWQAAGSILKRPFLSNNTSPSTEPQKETPSPPLKFESVDLDPEVDVIFECGPKRLLVSSAVIDLASSSFRTMIKDDPEALTLLFQTLHFVKPSDRPQLAVLEQFAVICDKYLCKDAVYAQVRYWVVYFAGMMDDDTSNSSILCKGIESLLTITYIFGLASEFSTLSGKLASLGSVTVRCSSTETDVSKPLKLHTYLPHVLQDDILRLCDRLMKGILETIETNLRIVTFSRGRHLITSEFICGGCAAAPSDPEASTQLSHTRGFCTKCRSGRTPPDEEAENPHSLCTASKRSQFFITWLEAISVWPWSKYTSNSPQSLLWSISRHPGFQSSRHECDGRVECALQIAIRKTEDGILEIVKLAKLDVTI